MKKLVLTLLLTIPHVAWGSEETDRLSVVLASSQSEAEARVDGHSYLDDSVELFQTIYPQRESGGRKEVRLRLNMKGKPSFDKFVFSPIDKGESFVAMGSEYLCLAFLGGTSAAWKQDQDPVKSAFILFKKNELLTTKEEPYGISLTRVSPVDSTIKPSFSLDYVPGPEEGRKAAKEDAGQSATDSASRQSDGSQGNGATSTDSHDTNSNQSFSVSLRKKELSGADREKEHIRVMTNELIGIINNDFFGKGDPKGTAITRPTLPSIHTIAEKVTMGYFGLPYNTPVIITRLALPNKTDD